jgi:hypothetical protein
MLLNTTISSPNLACRSNSHAKMLQRLLQLVVRTVFEAICLLKKEALERIWWISYDSIYFAGVNLEVFKRSDY